jgi:hypothetical protein
MFPSCFSVPRKLYRRLLINHDRLDLIIVMVLIFLALSAMEIFTRTKSR